MSVLSDVSEVSGSYSLTRRGRDFANPKLPYVLHTNASTTGLSAALYQEQEGQMRVIAFASRGLT